MLISVQVYKLVVIITTAPALACTENGIKTSLKRKAGDVPRKNP